MADDELLDVLDADDLHVVGRKTREDVHRDHDWHGTVFVWSAWESADVRLMLLQQRGRVGDPYAQMVDALAGGHIGAGETAIDGARRELTEEVGLAAEADNFIHLGSSRMERPDGECRRVYQSLLLYPLPLDIGGMQFSDEVDGFVEVDLDGFSDLVHGRCEHLPARAGWRTMAVTCDRSICNAEPSWAIRMRSSIPSGVAWRRFQAGCAMAPSIRSILSEPRRGTTTRRGFRRPRRGRHDSPPARPGVSGNRRWSRRTASHDDGR